MDARALLRRIALGLPLLALPIGASALITNVGCVCGGDCGEPLVVRRPVTDDQAASLRTDGALCRSLCEAAIVDAGVTSDVGIEDASGDAGFVSSSGRSWQCATLAGELTCTGRFFCGGGRAPQAFRERTRPRIVRSRLGDCFASMAHLEAAAVPAFFELADEMARHGAPCSMSRAARHSARQEITHARMVRRLAHRFGGEVPIVERGENAPRSLFEMAKDNAFEGCVREAYGALVAAHQAAHARDPEVRTSFARIAKDEAEHALLSFALHDWARSRVTDAERRALDETREEGLASLLLSTTADEPHTSLAIAGLPSATRANDLARTLAS
ncbi:MAG: ferritin-like domain-containing protein [Deltaproteobacteria bacterium]|nr:ferritin-like domain-containing protein [Deltaproteobacteria bacterium]